MIIKRAKLECFTVFESHVMDFNPGINIFVGENGTGKTHMMKLLYSACQAADPRVSFPHKVVLTMLPDEFKLSRLITRKRGNHTATVRITAADTAESQDKTLAMIFSNKTKKWDAEVTGETGWEQAFSGISSIFIPAKEILSNSYNLNAAVEKNNVRFDDTYLDILNAAKVDISVGRNASARDAMLKEIERITLGTVSYDPGKDEFYLKRGNSLQEFNLVAEGIRKMALLWQLVKNGTLENGSLLFWDEPEANINPTYISVIVELLLALQRKGVQIFISTHDYMLASYFEVRKQDGDNLLYHSLYKTNDGKVSYETGTKFSDLRNNAIISAFSRLLDEIYDL